MPYYKRKAGRKYRMYKRGYKKLYPRKKSLKSYYRGTDTLSLI